jgi:hypothetical protein
MKLKRVHTPLPHLTEGLGFMYLHGLDVLEIPSKTAHHLPMWVDLTLFENPTF